MQKKMDIRYPLKGESIAGPKLQYDALTADIPTASQYNKRCQSYSISDTKLIHGIKDAVEKSDKIVEGYWCELWTVKRCSQDVQIPI